MSLPLYILIGSTITLVIMTGVFRLEDARGKLLFFASVRRAFTRGITQMLERYIGWHPYVGRGFFRLLLHYFAHGFLRRVLNGIRRLEERVERLMRQNRQVAKSIDAEKRQSHLTAIAEHKIETALSEREKQRRRSHG
jgi:hypothetical protein